MISSRSRSQRTPPRQEFEHLTLCSGKVQQLRRAAPRTKSGKRLLPNSPLSLDLPRWKATVGKPSASSCAEIGLRSRGIYTG
jgi:hypothetical protein